MKKGREKPVIKKGKEKMKEKRLRERVLFETEITLTIGNATKKFTKTRDISMNGLFIETEKAIPRGTGGKLKLQLTLGEPKIIINSKFRVTRKTASNKNEMGKLLPAGIAIELFDFEGDSSEQLYNIIKYNRGKSILFSN